MLLTVKQDADVDVLRGRLQSLGLWTQILRDDRGQTTGFWVASPSPPMSADELRQLPGVAQVSKAASPHPLVDAHRGRSITVGPATLGGHHPVLIAGPCAVESEAQIFTAAKAAAHAGATLLRGGAFKPRTSPHAFGGHGRAALDWLREAADSTGLGVVTEAMAEADVEAVARVADMIQVGSRNMQNFALLRIVGRQGLPVLLKRGMAARIEEWLLAAEHLLAAGASDVVFCERGIVGFDSSTRNLLDLAAVALLKNRYGLSVVVDPSHALGCKDLVLPMAKAAIAAGADGIMVESHPDPQAALSDGPQALDSRALRAIGESLGLLANTDSRAKTPTSHRPNKELVCNLQP